MFEIILIIIIIILIIILIFSFLKIFSLKEEMDNLKFLKRSQSVRYGQLTEQWLPFTKNFPFNTQNFRFIGKPIDGLAFEKDKVVFVEIKSNKSQLSKIQKEVKELIQNKKVEWFELKAD